MERIERFAGELAAVRRMSGDEPGMPGHGQALVRMQAAAFNFLDLAVATGAYPGAAYPNVPVADGAGEVLAIGDGVDDIAVGDRVAVHPKSRWIAGPGTAENARVMRGVTAPGALAELVLVDAATLVAAPGHLSWPQIAALPIPLTTGWNALRAGGVGPGSTVVLPGTGVTALQTLALAKAAGARVIVTSSSDDRLARVRELGADHVINYRRQPEWQDAVLELTGGVGVDLVLETSGTATFTRSLQAVRQGGTVYTIGFVTGATASVDLLTIIARAIRVVGGNTGSVADLRAAMAVVAAHRLQPVIGRTFGVGEIADAYRALAAAGGFGKIAIRLDW